jgi:phosphoglucomutase
MPVSLINKVTGPYATRILVTELGLPTTSVINCIPQLDFANGHPDPNLTVPHSNKVRARTSLAR